MKKWFKFFFLSFFSHETSKTAPKRGYTNIFFAFLLALVFLFSGFVGGEMLPFGLHYATSPDFAATAHSVLANADADKRIAVEILNGDLKVRGQGSEYTESLLINTFESAEDKQTYSVNGVEVVVDSRPANALAEIEAYCISNDGKNTRITYQEYLTLSEVPRLNFDFKIRYTGKELVLTDELVESYKVYLMGLGDEKASEVGKLSADLADKKITREEYNRSIYELYFVSYYPEITAYETSSKVPLLRNYYYHQYISKNISDYLFIFDDYIAGAFTTSGGMNISFYGFYSNMENGALIPGGASQTEANEAVDDFIKDAFFENWFLNVYAHFLNTITLAPFIALMLLVAALLGYSVMKLLGIESVHSLGSMVKIVGSFLWPSGFAAGVFAVITGFVINRNLINTLPLVLFFVVLVIRSAVFVIKEKKLLEKQSEQQKAEQTEA